MTKEERTLLKEERKRNEQERLAQEKYLLDLHKKFEKEEEERRKNIKEAPSDDYVILKNINKVYDNNIQAVFDFSLNIKQHEFIVFVGPSGCGKSTTLRMVAGLESITTGDLFIDGVYSNELTPKERDIAMVFQNYALYPHMTVYENIAFGLRGRKEKKPVLDDLGNPIYGIDENIVKQYENKIAEVSSDSSLDEIEKEKTLNNLKEHLSYHQNKLVKKFEYVKLTNEEIDKRVKETANILELTPYLNRRPKEMSGGQCQRAALGRAISRDAKVFLMDEPLSNLDAKLRVSMRSEITRLHKQLKATTIYVTHDQTEAMTMADRIVVMKDGYIQQIDTPENVYNHPSNMFVATFIGAPSMNLLKATYDGKQLVFENGYTLPLTRKIVKAHNDFYKKQIAQIEEDIKNEVYKIPDGNAVLTAKKKKTTLKDLFSGKVEFVKIKSSEEKLMDMEKTIQDYKHYLKNPHEIVFGIRPEDIYFNTEFDSTVDPSEGKEITCELVELLGSKYFVYVQDFKSTIIGEAKANHKLTSGLKTKMYFDKNKIHLFDSISTKTIY